MSGIAKKLLRNIGIPKENYWSDFKFKLNYRLDLKN